MQVKARTGRGPSLGRKQQPATILGFHGWPSVYFLARWVFLVSFLSTHPRERKLGVVIFFLHGYGGYLSFKYASLLHGTLEGDIFCNTTRLKPAMACLIIPSQTGGTCLQHSAPSFLFLLLGCHRGSDGVVKDLLQSVLRQRGALQVLHCPDLFAQM